jgi:hypothetical protein
MDDIIIKKLFCLTIEFHSQLPKPKKMVVFNLQKSADLFVN